MSAGERGRGIDRTLVAVLAAGAAVRLAYVFLQPAFDPAFDRPMLDGAMYLEAARGLLGGDGFPEGAFYLAPGYPVVLAALLAISGGGLTLVYLAQHGAVVGAAALLARVARSIAGKGAATATAVFALAYGPLLFYPSRPLAEAVAILLLAVSLALAYRDGRRAAAACGVAAGLASLFRPNLLPVPVLWAAGRARGRPVGAALVLAGAAAVVLPVTVRNFVASGHFVPVSSNAGITLYHGNGPGAAGGFTAPEGFSGAISDQRITATAIASRAVGRPLDDVEADRWWGRQAVRARRARPAETASLLARRVALTVSSREISVDYAPENDLDPARFGAPLPFGVLLGFALAAVARRGFRGTGGWTMWSTVLTCAAAPVVFYVSSRYRLPLAAALCVPAGIGAADLPAWLRGGGRGKAAAAAFTIGVAVSFLPVGSGMADEARATALANRATSWQEQGRSDRALADLQAALALDPSSAHAWYNLGVARRDAGDAAGAEEAYRRALAIDPGHAEAAGNLGADLVRAGRIEEAIEILRAAVARRPGHAVCRRNLVVALASAGRFEEAMEEIESARLAEIPVPEALESAVREGARARSPSSEERP